MTADYGTYGTAATGFSVLFFFNGAPRTHVTDLIDSIHFCPSLREMPRPRWHISLRAELVQGFSATARPPIYTLGVWMARSGKTEALATGSPQPSMVLAADADPERAQLLRDQHISAFLSGGHEFSSFSASGACPPHHQEW